MLLLAFFPSITCVITSKRNRIVLLESLDPSLVNSVSVIFFFFSIIIDDYIKLTFYSMDFLKKNFRHS